MTDGPGAVPMRLPREPTDVFFSGDDRSKGILEWPPGSPAARPWRGAPGRLRGRGGVVAHPHPLYGGTMLQPVVYRVARACRERGFASCASTSGA